MKVLFPLFFDFIPILIFALATLFSFTSSTIPNDLMPLNKYESQDTLSYSVFHGVEREDGNDTEDQLRDFQGMVKIGDFYYIYGRENIFVTTLEGEDPKSVNISLIQRVEWKSHDDDVNLCIRKGQSDKNCKSFIKLFQEDARRENMQKQVIVCSTNAFKPECRIYQLLDSGKLTRIDRKISGSLLCPHNPKESVASMVADGNLYSASVIGFGGQDALLFRSSRTSSLVNLRTPRADQVTLSDPEFIRFVDAGYPLQKVFVFFKETAIEDRSHKVYSRVAQACKNDQGGNNFFRNQFSSFFKARLNCSIPGQPNFYFDEISDVTDFVTINHGIKGSDKVVFAIMNTPRNSIPASAICAFTIGSIETAMSGSFMGKHISIRSGRTYWEKEDNYPKPHLAKCSRPARLSHSNLNFIRKHPLMYSAVSSWNDGAQSLPVFARTSSRSFLTSLAVDTSSGLSSNYTVVIAGTEDGKILKVLVLRPNKAVLLEERSVFNAERCTGSKFVRKILLDKASGSMLIAFQNCVVRAPLCPLLSSNCARECIQSRDPYCGWNGANCTTVKNTNFPGKGEMLQDVAEGNAKLLPNCSQGENLSFRNESKESSETNDLQADDDSAGNPRVTTLALIPESDVRNEKPNQEASYLYVIAGVACLVLGFVIGILVCVFDRKWRLRKEKAAHTADKNLEKTLTERRESYNNRSNSIGSQYVKRNSNPRVSLIIDPKRKRTMTESSFRSEEGLLFYPTDANLAQERANTRLRSTRSRQAKSASSCGPDRQKVRNSRPSVNSDLAKNDDVSDNSERHSSPLSDAQYEDPFSDDPEVSRHRSTEQPLAPPELYAASVPPTSAKMRPTSRSMSFQGGNPNVMQRASSMGAATYTLEYAHSRAPNRKYSLQLPNGVVASATYQQHLIAAGPPKTYSWINQYQTDGPFVYDKNLDPGRIATDFTHSLDRRKRRPNGMNGHIGHSESYDTYRHPMYASSRNAYPVRKRIASESEKVTRSSMSRPPIHHAINEEGEGAVALNKQRNLSAKFLRNYLKLELPKNNQMLAGSQQTIQSPTALDYSNATLQDKGSFSKRLLDHSSPAIPTRGFKGSEKDSSRSFGPQRRNFSETACDPQVNDTTPFLPHSSSPRAPNLPPNFTSRERLRQYSENFNGTAQPLPSPNRISAPVVFDTVNNGAERFRHSSEEKSSRIPHSPMDGSQAYVGASSPTWQAGSSSLLYT